MSTTPRHGFARATRVIAHGREDIPRTAPDLDALSRNEAGASPLRKTHDACGDAVTSESAPVSRRAVPAEAGSVVPVASSSSDLAFVFVVGGGGAIALAMLVLAALPHRVLRLLRLSGLADKTLDLALWGIAVGLSVLVGLLATTMMR
jgi:hypothetical protein